MSDLCDEAWSTAGCAAAVTDRVIVSCDVLAVRSNGQRDPHYTTLDDSTIQYTVPKPFASSVGGLARTFVLCE